MLKSQENSNWSSGVQAGLCLYSTYYFSSALMLLTNLPALYNKLHMRKLIAQFLQCPDEGHHSTGRWTSFYFQSICLKDKTKPLGNSGRRHRLCSTWPWQNDKECLKEAEAVRYTQTACTTSRQWREIPFGHHGAGHRKWRIKVLVRVKGRNYLQRKRGLGPQCNLVAAVPQKMCSVQVKMPTQTSLAEVIASRKATL